MIQSLKKTHDKESPKRVSINEQMITSINLNNFVTSTSKVLFQKLKLPSSFLQNNPDAWNDDNDFLLPELKVVKDHAERGVALIQSTVG